MEPASIGPYEILGRLGEGGGGVVYRAQHRKSGQPAAVKVVSLPSAKRFGALRRELRALERLEHPGIVRVLSTGTQDGQPWVAMELHEGPTLLLWAQRHWNPRPTGLAAGFQSIETNPPILERQVLGKLLAPLVQLCGTLAFLHGEGLVHCDLKPSNVIMTPRGQPVLLDFGLASRYSGAPGREALDPARRMEGSVATMAPEQIRGEPVDARTDLYALGCVAYELLSGRLPFEGKETRDILEGHLFRAPSPPSRWVGGLPAELDALVVELLQKKPEARPGYADTVGAHLARLAEPAERRGAVARSRRGAPARAPRGAPRPRAYLYRPGLVGRESALGVLDRALTELQAGRGGVVLIEGESGGGKTRVAVELMRRARERRLQVGSAECLPPAASGTRPPRKVEGVEGTVGGDDDTAPSDERPRLSQPTATSAPLYPLRPILQAVADRCREAGAVETERLLGPRGLVLAPYDAALESLPGLDAYGALPVLPVRDAQLRLFRALLETLRAFGAARPGAPHALLLVLDDLQWADELTLGWLTYLQRVSEAEPLGLLVVGTCRIEEMPESLQHLRDRQGVVRISLERLNTEGVHTIVRDMLALGQTPSPLIEALARHTEGNPFFVAEYLRAAVEEGHLERDERGRWRMLTTLQEGSAEQVAGRLPLPGTIRDLMQRRLAGVGALERPLLAAAAVLGRECEPEVLAVVAACSQRKLLDGVSELQRRHVLEPAGGRLRFTHEKLREAAYGRLRESQRRVLHRRAAEALSLTDAKTRAAELGRHWEAAGVLDAARSSYLTAAREMCTRYAHQEAERLYRAYLRLVPEPTAERLTALNELGERVLLPRGQLEEAQGLHREALEIARATGHLPSEGTSLQKLGIIYWRTGRSVESRDTFERVIELAQKLGDLRLEAAATGVLASVHREQSRLDMAAHLYVRALALARELRDLPLETIALSRLAVLHYDQGHLDEARGLYEQHLALARQTGMRNAEGVALSNLAIIHYDQGRLDEARPYYERALTIAREVGSRREEAVGLANFAILHMGQRRLQEARGLFQQALAMAREIGDPRLEAIIKNNLADLWLVLGQPAEARRLGTESIQQFRALGERRFLGMSLSRMAGLERRVTGSIERAEPWLAEALDTSRQVGDALHLALALCERGHLELARGVSAEALLEEATEVAAPLGGGPQSDVRAALGRLQAAQAAFDAGQPLFRGELWEDLPADLRDWLQEHDEEATA